MSDDLKDLNISEANVPGYDEIMGPLSREEREAVMKIFKEVLANDGKSELLDKLKYADFDEIPVDIHTFLHDRTYLGNGLYDRDGRFTLFPY